MYTDCAVIEGIKVKRVLSTVIVLLMVMAFAALPGMVELIRMTLKSSISILIGLLLTILSVQMIYYTFLLSKCSLLFADRDRD